MKKFKYILGCLLLGSLAIGFQACKKNPELPVKDVVFTDSVKSYTVTFTNTTTDAKSFRWDFGDTTSSTETNPVHTYKAKGKHVVTLYATLNNGNVINGSTIIHVSKSSPILLNDNTLADWDTISNIVIPPTAALGGVVQEAKFDYDSQNIYIYMKLAVHVTDANIFDFYLDTDNSALTGLTTGAIPGGGYDYLLEGQVLYNTGTPLVQYQHTGAQNSFSFNALSIAGFYTLGTVQEVNGVTTFEMALSRSKISGLTGGGMKIAIIVSDDAYNNIGWMPGNGSAPITLDISQ
ncbi:PKD domain-containing protein [Mucilaginibacter sp. L196]|uniref:PKD domain-containing protein n=1 Tax=Mucilaginibacter sp. L196 TaxID=1641870 RepID=UPI00131B70B2|nr:PKD domain-containing protein [Mucilaginibacter sp. L196]